MKLVILWLLEQITCIFMFVDAYMFIGHYFITLLVVIAGLFIGYLIEKERAKIKHGKEKNIGK